MAIEFSCPHCEHLLRTADDKAGLSAKCPACGEIIHVPYSTHAAAATESHESAEPPPEIGIPLSRDQESGAADDAAAPPSDASPLAAGIPRRRAGLEIECPGCHATNDATSPNCRFCGTSLEGVEPVAHGEPPPIPPFDVGEIMNTSWKLYTQELGLMIGACVVMMLVTGIAIAVFVIPLAVIAIALQDDALFVLIPGVIGLLPVLIALQATMMVGNTQLYLKLARGDGASIGDLFFGLTEGRGLILPAIFISLAAGVLSLLGLLICCAPGILVILCAWPAMPLLVDRRLTGSDAIGRTIEFAKLQLGQVLAVGAIAFGIQLVANVPYIGPILLLFAYPLAQLITIIGYLRMTSQPTQFERWTQPTASPPANA